jgi:phosphatidylserine/phosphatidylglycerophosphate/cardiolipin synthase-like enzyme
VTRSRRVRGRPARDYEAVGKWFLLAEQRGNPDTRIDRRHAEGLAWTEGNSVQALVHGATYFARLHACLSELASGDRVYFTDWRGDPGQRLRGPGTELAPLLRSLLGRGIAVRGLVWRSHPDQGKFSEQENQALGKVVNEAGGEVLMDERVRRAGCHHQKLVLLQHLQHEDDDVAFVGGIDLCHGRADDEHHHGDHQAIVLNKRYGPRPAWHDVQLEIRGPAVGDIAETFRERWEDPTPLDHKNPWRARLARLRRQPRRARPLPPMPLDPGPAGPLAVQIVRTYPAKNPPFPFAPKGERSVARAYLKAFRRARSLIYLEDQYLWSDEISGVLAAALRRSPELRLIAVVPRFPDSDGILSGPPNRIGQQVALRRIREAGRERVAFYDLENDKGFPIYVHAKVCVVDDVWATVGSDNMNRRSWTHDSELSCAVLDSRRDGRSPTDPGGMGDGARVFARELRLELWREHLGHDVADAELLDPSQGFETLQRAALARDAWHERGRKGPPPPGRLRMHVTEPVRPWAAWWAAPAYRILVDPDGRPGKLKRARQF